jgi:hypothetical protein
LRISRAEYDVHLTAPPGLGALVIEKLSRLSCRRIPRAAAEL